MVKYIPIAIIGLLLGLFINRCQKAEENANLVDSLRAEVKHSKDKLGRNVATIRIIETDKKNLLRLNAEGDSMLARLQAEARRAGKNLGGLTVLTTETEGKASGKTIAAESVLPAQTPEDTTKIKIVGLVRNKQLEAKVVATPDSVHLVWYKLKNEFVFTQTFESGGFLKPKIPIVNITTNPGTTVTEAKSFRVTPPRQYNGLKFLGGFALGAFGMYQLKK